MALELSLRSFIVCLLPALLLAACDRQDSKAPQPNATAAAPAPAGGEPAGTLDMAQRGSAMPKDAFTTPEGKATKLADFKGEPLLVNLWATWCGPCVKEMPSLDRLAARTKGKLHVMVVNQDSNKQAVDPVPEWWAKAKLANLQPYRDAENNLGFAFGGGLLPTTVLYDAQGKEVWRISGGMDWDGPRANTLLADYL
jgi:thiol-disulfide isomerase/thioredoxin